MGSKMTISGCRIFSASPSNQEITRTLFCFQMRYYTKYVGYRDKKKVLKKRELLTSD